MYDFTRSNPEELKELADTVDRASTQVKQELRHLLGHYDRVGGYKAGSFTSRLISAWEKADPMNSALLSGVFPALGTAIDIYRKYPAEAIASELNRAHQRG